MTNVTVSPLINPDDEQVTVTAGGWVHPELAETSVVPDGTVSVTVKPALSDGPWLVTFIE